MIGFYYVPTTAVVPRLIRGIHLGIRDGSRGLAAGRRVWVLAV